MKIMNRRTVHMTKMDGVRYRRIETENGTVVWEKCVPSKSSHGVTFVPIRGVVQSGLEQEFQSKD